MSVLSDLRDRADTLRGTKELGFCTDSETDPARVALAISTPAHSFVVTIDKAEYDGLALMRILGFETEQATAFERAAKEKKRA